MCYNKQQELPPRYWYCFQLLLFFPVFQINLMCYSSELNMQSSFDCIEKLSGLSGLDSFQGILLNMHRGSSGEEKLMGSVQICHAF